MYSESINELLKKNIVQRPKPLSNRKNINYY